MRAELVRGRWVQDGRVWVTDLGRLVPPNATPDVTQGDYLIDRQALATAELARGLEKMTDALVQGEGSPLWMSGMGEAESHFRRAKELSLDLE